MIMTVDKGYRDIRSTAHKNYSYPAGLTNLQPTP